MPECGGYATGEAEWVCGEDRVEISDFPSPTSSLRSVSFRHAQVSINARPSDHYTLKQGPKAALPVGAALCLPYFLFFVSQGSDSLTWQSS